MRLQLSVSLISVLGSLSLASAQTDSLRVTQYPTSKPVDVNFLFNYYEQDGDHSAVTGGTGTEKLKDIATKIIVNIPLDSESRLSATVGMNYYSSASTDNINSNVSSASKDDYRGQLHLSYTRTLPANNTTYGFSFGGSVETDYISLSFGGTWAKEFARRNSEIVVNGQVFFDKWMPIFPDELRRPGQELIRTDRRRSYYLSVTYSQVLTKRLQASLITELVFQHGLLSTPFHRVFFQNLMSPKVERLPDERFKYPIGLRLHYFLNDYVVVRTFFRSYFDSFGITAKTLVLELPIKVSPYFSLYPSYRFHNQTDSDYFEEAGRHDPANEFYTSDWDLSSFDSHRFGMGMRLAPLYGITAFKIPFSKAMGNFRSLDLRYANYRRQDGLRSSYISVDLALRFE